MDARTAKTVWDNDKRRGSVVEFYVKRFAPDEARAAVEAELAKRKQLEAFWPPDEGGEG